MKKFATIVFHLAMLSLVCAIAAYWAIRIMTPAPASAPPPQSSAVPREAEPALAARMFGLIQAAPVQLATNVQALGVFAAGKDSAAVLAIDGKPARVYLLNQEIASGTTLVEVRKDAVTIEQSGVRRDVALPEPEPVNLGSSAPPPSFRREGNTLTAPTVQPGIQAGGVPPRPLPPRPGAVAQQPAPQLPQPILQPVPPQPAPAELPQPIQPQPIQPQQIQPQQMQPADEAQPGGPVRRAMPNRPLSQ